MLAETVEKGGHYATTKSSKITGHHVRIRGIRQSELGSQHKDASRVG
jgi:hypothetical protein